MSEEPTLEQLQQEAIEFRQQREGVMLSTVSAEGVPDASYAPCVLDGEGRSYVLVSRLARHTGNLLSRPQASLMWIESTAGGNAFARRRLIVQCNAEIIERDSDAWQGMVALMQSRFGKTVELLAGLQDFMLFRFDAVEGNYIRGFAQAYPVRGNDLVMQSRRTR